MNFLGLFTFTAPYLPWVLVAFSALIGGSPIPDLLGLLVGHIYYFFEDIYPSTLAGRGRHLLSTPRFLYALIPPGPRFGGGTHGGFAMPGAAPPPGAGPQQQQHQGGQPGGGIHRWGQGQRLGGAPEFQREHVN